VKLKSVLLSLTAISVTLTACNSLSPIGNNSATPVDHSFSSEAADGKGVVEIKLKQKTDTLTLNQQGLDLFGFNPTKKTIRARVSLSELDFLKSNKFTFSSIKESNMTSRGLLPGYMTYKEMKAKLQNMEKQYPDLVTLMDVGDSWEKTSGKSPDNDIWTISISNKKNKGNKQRYVS